MKRLTALAVLSVLLLTGCAPSQMDTAMDRCVAFEVEHMDRGQDAAQEQCDTLRGQMTEAEFIEFWSEQ